MNFGLSDDQVLLKNTIKRFLDEQCPTARVRTIMETANGHDPALWNGLVDLGVAGLVVPAAYGGSGLELLDLALAAEEFGYAATPGPFLGVAMGMFVTAYMWSLGILIGGGTANIQRNVIAERGLGLPRDAAASRR